MNKARRKPIATASTIARQVQVGLSSGPAVQVAGGAPVLLRVPLPKSVRKRLKQLPPRRALQARIDVKATNHVPYVGTHEIKVNLPGRKWTR